MGCEISTAETPAQNNTLRFRNGRFENIHANSAPRPEALSFTKIDETQKQMLWDIIQSDNVQQLAFYLDEQEIPVNVELQGDESYWTLTHFCARWDAVKSLSYVLKEFYDEQPQNYVKFVNMQTMEGYTALQLSVTWNAKRCFSLLLDCGGIDLSLRDNRGADAYSEAVNMRRTEALNVLQTFRQQNIYMINVATKQLQKEQDLNDLLISTDEEIEQQSRNMRRFDSNLRAQYLQNFRIQQEAAFKKQQEEMEKLIEQNKINTMRIAEEKRQLLERQKQLQDQALKKNLEEQKKARQQQAQQAMVQALKQEQALKDAALAKQKELQEQQRQKEKQIEEQKKLFIEKQRQLQEQQEQELKKAIEQQKKAEEERLARLKKEQEEQARRDAEQKNKDQQTQEEAEMQKKIQQQRELLKKQLEQKKNQIQNAPDVPVPATVTVTSKTSAVGQCPPELKSLYDDLVAKKKNFVDASFPPKLETIGDLKKIDQDMRMCVWLRPNQIFSGPYEVFDGIEVDDIQQGSLGVCYYLSTLSSLAEDPENIKKLFAFYDKDLGFYVLRFYVHGKPTNIVVDDYFPCFKGTNEPLFTKPKGNEIWVMLLQKAWVKNFGSYLSAEAMSPDTMMEDVTGAPAQGLWIEDVNEAFQNMLTYDKQQYIQVLTSLDDKVPKGIVSGHAYSLLSAYNINGVKLLKIRNPWGNFEWDGQYGSNSRKWTPQLKKAVQEKDEDDGIFYMTPAELTTGFNFYSVGMISKGYVYSHIPVTCKPEESVYYKFTIKNKMWVNLRFVQKFDRFINDKNYKYSPLIFEYGKIQGPEDVTLLGEGSDNSVQGDKSVFMHEDPYHELEPGTYFIRLAVKWNSNINDGVLAAYAPETLTFTPCGADEGLKHWKNMMRKALLESEEDEKSEITPGVFYAQKWFKGQYIFCGQNTTAGTVELTITFKSSSFENCRLGLKKQTTEVMKMQMRAKDGSNIGTIEKIKLADACSIGSLNFTVKKL